MTESLARVWRVALTECAASFRNRRAAVMVLLFVAVSALVMYGTVSGFAAMEEEVVRALGLPPADNPGAVTLTLWKSKAFSNVIERLSGGSLVFADIRGRHPIVLAYAFFIFQVAPLLTLLVSAPRVADDIRAGAARYWLVRVTRTEWSLGKFFGEALMLAGAMTVGALAAETVAVVRLPGGDGLRLLPELVDWTLRAWTYALAWLGLFCGISHLAKSGGRATALSILAMLGAAAWPVMLANLAREWSWCAGLGHLDLLAPGSALSLLWRRSPAVLFQGVTHLAALAFLYLSLGCAVFNRRDV